VFTSGFFPLHFGLFLRFYFLFFILGRFFWCNLISFGGWGVLENLIVSRFGDFQNRSASGDFLKGGDVGYCGFRGMLTR
jgi:hypothetical protein